MTFQQWVLEFWWPCGKVFLLVLNLLAITFDLFLSDINQNFQIMEIRDFILQMSITQVLQSRYLFLCPWSPLELAIIGVFVYQIHILFTCYFEISFVKHNNCRLVNIIWRSILYIPYLVHCFSSEQPDCMICSNY